MKKIIAFILCLMILCVPIVASAEGGEVIEGDVSTPEVETPVDEEIQPPTETTPTFEEEVELMSEQIKEWLLSNAEEISVIVTLISTCLVLFMRLKTVIKSTGTLNNNAITIAKTSNDAIAKALADIEAASAMVTGYEEKIVALLEAFKTTAEDKLKLETELVEIKNYLNTSSKSNLEFADDATLNRAIEGRTEM